MQNMNIRRQARIALPVAAALLLGVAVTPFHAAAADQTAARQKELTIIQMRLGLADIAPADVFIGHDARYAGGHARPEIGVLGPRFQQQHTVFARHGKPVGEHAASRTRADNDVIVIRCSHFCARFLCQDD